MKSIKEVKVSGRRVILRADLDVPLKDGKVGDDTRLKALLPTLKYLLKNKAKVLIIGHLGRPKGRKDPKLSLAPVAARLSELVGRDVVFPAGDTSKVSVDLTLEVKEAGFLAGTSLAMLENLRFYRGEIENDPAFAKKLAALGELYVSDAFAVSHRQHASIAGIPELLPAYVGLHLEEEVKELGTVLENPKRPLVFILGGAKVETKEPLVSKFAEVSDKVLIGGLLMFSQELEGIPNVVFPVDAVETYDIGSKSIKLFVEIIKSARTVVWNGPMGKWEEPRYERGTRMIANELARMGANVKTIVGGGDTIAALNAFSLLSKMNYVSLGGGAMLEFLAGKKLSGLEALGYY